MGRKSASTILPGFGLTLGITITYVGVLVLLPLGLLVVRAMGVAPADFLQIASSQRVLAACSLSFGAAFAAALINVLFGTLVSWVLVRYSFPGKRIVDGLVDLPFALPTAVAGIALTSIYAGNGWFGKMLSPLGINVAFTRLGVLVALVFVGLPFVVRTVQPVLEDLDFEVEEAAATLGAGRLRTVFTLILPAVWPGILTGFSLSFARGLGEYGSVVFISGNMPMKTEIVPLLIMTRLEQYDYRGAVVLGTIMLAASLLFLLIVNLLQSLRSRGSRRSAAGGAI